MGLSMFTEARPTAQNALTDLQLTSYPYPTSCSREATARLSHYGVLLMVKLVSPALNLLILIFSPVPITARQFSRAREAEHASRCLQWHWWSMSARGAVAS